MKSLLVILCSLVPVFGQPAFRAGASVSEISARAEARRSSSFVLGNDFEGKLDEVAIFERALTVEEIAGHFKAANLVP